MKESHEIQEANENIKKVKKMGFQTLYQFGGKYYTVSTSPMADETAIFNSDKNGDVKDYREIWSERERVSHDYAIKDYIDNKFKAFGVQIESFELDEGVGQYQLKKNKVEKNEQEGEDTQIITYYDILKGGKKVGSLQYENFFGSVRGELHGKPLPETYPGSKDPQAWLHGFLKSSRGGKFVMESVDLDEATIPRDAQVVDRNKEEKTVTLKWHDGEEWQTAEVPEDEVPGFYDRAADPMKKRKTDRFGNIMKPPAKGAEKKTEKAMAANKKDAEEILAIFKKKPMKTPITIIGTKWGKAEEYEMVVMRRMYQGDEVFVVKSSGRFVELRPTAAGLQVIDQKTKKILLDKGKDAVW